MHSQENLLVEFVLVENKDLHECIGVGSLK